MNYANLNDEQKAKVMACQTPEDVLKLAQSEGVELSDEDLEAVSGGSWGADPKCPECGSERVVRDSFLGVFICQNCGCEFT